MKPETQELLTRMEKLISNPNVNHNPYNKNREEWLKETKEKIEEIKKINAIPPSPSLKAKVE